jgi:predicted lysophospholipase L1 biosynthesis ABC-type transport system permease subunit
MNNRNYCLASGTVFAIVALMHIWRVVLDFPLQIGAWHAPRSLSLLGAIGAAILAGWAFRSARKTTPAQTVYT